MKITISFTLFFIFFGSGKDLTAQNTAKKWEVVDLSFRTENLKADPFLVNLSATFTHQDGIKIEVPGFFNGNKSWIIRFSPSLEGKWSYITNSSFKEFNGKSGELTVAANNPDQHGPVIVSEKNRQRFSYADGRPYNLLAYETDWLFALDWANTADIPKTRELIQEISKNGFNHIVMNVYAYDADWGERDKIRPEHNFAQPAIFPFGGTNEAPDYTMLNISFFKHLDRVIAYLNEKGIIAHLMIYVWNKHVNWPDPGSVADNLYFDYVVKRYQAYPNIVWDISKEALSYGRDDISYISDRIDRLRNLDGFDRLVSVHDYRYCSSFPEKVDFISIQEWVPDLYDAMLKVAAANPDKPVLNIEHGGYEKTMHTIFAGAYSDPVGCLMRNYECVFAGTYSTYYWQNSSWYEIIYNLSSLPQEQQPHLGWYKILAHLLEQYCFEKLQPTQYASAPHALVNPENLLLFYVPEYMDVLSGEVPILNGKTVRVKWFDPFTEKFMKAKPWILETERGLDYIKIHE